MAEKKPACKTAKSMATSLPGVDSDISVCGCSAGLPVFASNVLTLTFEGGVLLDEKKYDGKPKPLVAMDKEPAHPSGITVEIVGIEKGDCCQLCKEHNVCMTVVEEDILLHPRKEQILVDGQEETAITCYWVTDGID